MKKKIFLSILLSIIVLTGCAKETNKEKTKIVENKGMLSYTIDGEKTDIKPTKEAGYIVNKIICDNGSDMMWDNDNWEVELTRINSKDRCKVDFTKDANALGFRIAVISNIPSALDSLSKATTENGTVIIYSTSKIESVTGCNGVIEDNKVIVSNITSNQTCNIEIEDKTLAGVIKRTYPPQPGRTDFTKIDNGPPTLYTDEDDDGATYYFSGDGTSMNNWISFAESMWRIIRINGNDSVRLLYVGNGIDGYLKPSDVTNASELGMNDSGRTNGQMTYNNNYNNPAYVGWKYSTSGENGRGNIASNIYKAVENWYNNKIKLSYDNYIDNNAIYCNDRRASWRTNENDGVYNSFNASTNTSGQWFGANKRVARDNNVTPTLKCETSDRFIKFGLMTADEIVLAGGVFNIKNESAYYYLNKSGMSSTGSYLWWTMSPSVFLKNSNMGARVFAVTGQSGLLYEDDVWQSGVVRPVISLKSNVLVTGGDGSGTNPYTLQMP